MRNLSVITDPQAPAPDDGGEALPDLDPRHTPPADRFDGEAWRGRVKVDDDWAHVAVATVKGATLPMFYWHGKWRCFAESFGNEVMAAWARAEGAHGYARGVAAERKRWKKHLRGATMRPTLPEINALLVDPSVLPPPEDEPA